jgi:hypothetical protein
MIIIPVCNLFATQSLVSDGERVKGVRSPSPKGNQSVEHTFIKDDHDMVDSYVDDMKKGTWNILVSIFSLSYKLVMQVAVRLRPLWNKEKEQDNFEIVRILD